MPRKRLLEVKKFCKLENGTIEPCFYADGTMRTIYKRGWYWYLDHDVYAHQLLIYKHSKIIDFADTVEELQK